MTHHPRLPGTSAFSRVQGFQCWNQDHGRHTGTRVTPGGPQTFQRFLNHVDSLHGFTHTDQYQPQTLQEEKSRSLPGLWVQHLRGPLIATALRLLQNLKAAKKSTPLTNTFSLLSPAALPGEAWPDPPHSQGLGQAAPSPCLQPQD